MSETSTLPVATSAGEEYRRLARFQRRPSLSPRIGAGFAAGLRATVRLYILDIAAMVALMMCLIAVLAVTGMELPSNALSELELSWGVVGLVVIGAPVAEEVLFRGWLSGRARHLLAIPAIFVGIGALGAFAASGIAGAGIWGMAALALFLGLAALLLWTGRTRPPMRWFAWAFPLFFWLSTIAFALVHLLNYQEGNAVYLLPLVLPQFVLGALLGYLRVTAGLFWNIALHAMHNATALGVVAIATAAGS